MITDPRDIPGLVLWLSAEAITGLADGATLTSWADLSPAGHNTTGVNGTPTWQATAGPGGGPAVRFPATDHYLTLPAILAGAAAGEVMATVKAANAGAQQNSWKFGTATGDPTNHYPFSNGTIYEDFGRTVRTSFAPAGVDLTAWHRYNVWSAAGDWCARLNETVKATDANTGVGFHATPKLGNVGTFATQPLHYGAVVVYSRKLTTPERDDLAAWLTAHPSGGTLPPPPPPPDPEPEPDPVEWFTHEQRSQALETFTAATGAPEATVTLSLARGFAPVAPVLGERFRIALTTDEVTRLGIDPADAPRFTGEVTDCVTDETRHLVTGVGRWARHGRYPINGTSWPVEDDGARVARILAATRSAGDVGTIDPGTADLLPPTEKATPAASLVDVARDSTTGRLVERRDGRLDWHDAEHRRAAPVRLTLTAAEVFGPGFTWATRVGDLVNDAQVTYGRAGTAVRVRDGASDDVRGPYPAQVSTALVDESAAYELGALIVSRRAEPAYQLPTVQVDVLRTVLDPERRAVLLNLGAGDRIKVTGIPASPDTAQVTELDLFVELVTEAAWRTPGRHDTPTRDAWRLVLTVSDPALSGTAIRWKDLPVGLAWTELAPGLSWLDLGRIEDPADPALTTP